MTGASYKEVEGDIRRNFPAYREEHAMGNVERKLMKLFDFQKFEKEPELDAVIAGVNGKPSGIRKLTDDELEYAAGGVMAGGSSDDSQAYGRCTVKGCGGLLSPTLDGFICGSCKQKYNKDKTKWGGNLLEGNNNNSGINPKFT